MRLAVVPALKCPRLAAQTVGDVGASLTLGSRRPALLNPPRLAVGWVNIYWEWTQVLWFVLRLHGISHRAGELLRPHAVGLRSLLVLFVLS